jgi:ABC-2 type transport system permease protein
MSMLFQLMKPDLMSIYGINRMMHRSKGAGRAAFRPLLVGLAVLYCVGVYLYGIAAILMQMDALSYLPVLTLAFSLAFPLITTTFRVENVLFKFHNQDALRAMPIPTRTLVASRILVLTSFDAVTSYLFLLPTVVVYAMLARPGAIPVLCFAVCALLSPLLSVSVSALLGCLLLRVTSRFVHSKAVNIIAGFVFFGLVMAASFSLNFAIAQDSLGGMVSLVTGLAGVFPFDLLYRATLGSLVDALAFALLCGGCFALCAWFISAFYDKLGARLMPRVRRVRGEEKPQPVRTPRQALLRQELKRYFSLPIYVLNTAFGAVLMLLFSVLIAVFSPQKLGAMMEAPEIARYIGLYAPAVLSLFVLMSSTTACAISLDGKSFSTLRAMPVGASAYLRAKLDVNLLVTVPAALVSSAILIATLRLSPLQAVAAVVTPLACALFSAVTGLYFNLMMPRLDWQTETAVVKQSMSVLATMLVGFVAAGVVFGLSMWTGALLALDAVVISLSLLLQRHNARRGYDKMLKKLDA